MPLEIVSYVTNPGAGGKFVVLVPRGGDDGGALLFSDFTRDFQHADIVRRWEKARGVSASSSGRAISGGGWWRMEGTRLILYGQSAAYGRFDPVWVRARLEAGTVMAESRIDVL